MSETYVWILGVGRLLFDKQFTLDINRMRHITINGLRVRSNMHDVARYLYHATKHRYFLYSKYMNQGIGNVVVQELQCLLDLLVVPVQKSLRMVVDTRSGTVGSSMVVRILRYDCSMYCKLHCTYRMSLSGERCLQVRAIGFE
jgi:hypothetical protein